MPRISGIGRGSEGGLRNSSHPPKIYSLLPSPEKEWNQGLVTGMGERDLACSGSRRTKAIPSLVQWWGKGGQVSRFSSRSGQSSKGAGFPQPWVRAVLYKIYAKKKKLGWNVPRG
jgi:hypothetical protein